MYCLHMVYPGLNTKVCAEVPGSLLCPSDHIIKPQRSIGYLGWKLSVNKLALGMPEAPQI